MMLRYVAVAILAVVVAFFGARAFLSRQASDEQDRQARISALNAELQSEAKKTEDVPQSQWRRLSDHQRATLLAAFKAHRSELQNIVVYAFDYAEPQQYAAQFVDVLREAGVTYQEREVPPDTSVYPGLVILLLHGVQPRPEGAETLMNSLTAAGLDVQYIDREPKNLKNEDHPYGFFIGPMQRTGQAATDR